MWVALASMKIEISDQLMIRADRFRSRCASVQYYRCVALSAPAAICLSDVVLCGRTFGAMLLDYPGGPGGKYATPTLSAGLLSPFSSRTILFNCAKCKKDAKNNSQSD